MPKKISRRNFLRGAAAGGALLSSGLWAPRIRAQGTTPTNTPAPTNTPVPLPEGTEGTLSVIHRTEYFEQVQTLFRDTVVNFAEEKNMGLDISTANPEAFGDFLSKMQAAVQAGNPPDIAYTSNISISQMHLLDPLEDVSDVVAEAESRYGRIMPGTNAAKNAQFDGAWKAIPFISTATAYLARGDKYSAAGIDPLSLETYDQRREAALAVSDPDNEFWGWGLTPNQSGDGWGFLVSVINSFGGGYTDETGMIVNFNTPETLAALEWLVETYTDPKYAAMIPPGVLSWGDISNNEAWIAGTIGYTHNAFSVYAQSKRDQLEFYPDITLMRAPLGPGGISMDGGSNSWLTIFKGSKNIDAAKELALYLLDPVNFVPMSSLGAGLFMPAYENVWTEELIAADRNFATIKEIVSIEEPFIGASWPAQPNAAIDAIRANGIVEQMVANVTSGRMSTTEALEDAHDRIVDIFEEGGIEQP